MYVQRVRSQIRTRWKQSRRINKEANRIVSMSCSWSMPEAAANAVTPLAASLMQYPVLEVSILVLRRPQGSLIADACLSPATR